MNNSSLTDTQKTQLTKLEKRLRRNVGQAIAEYNMIEDGDKIMVCLSGGKDSYALLSILMLLKESAPINFELVAVNLDQKQPGFPEHILPNYLKELGIEYQIIEEDTYAIVKDKIPEGKTTCSLCSRLRRAVLYKAAKALGATKIALGHHRDDMIETLMLNMFYGGKMKSMPAKLVSDNGEHVVIRPLAFCKESELIQYGELKKFPIIPCNLCGSQPNLQRQNIKRMLNEWNEQSPGRIESMFTAMKNIVPSHLCDSQLFNFKEINSDSGIVNGGDTAFDQESFSADNEFTQKSKQQASSVRISADLVDIIEVK
ncbi:tRNA 2-thiocytidine(32) synthetase TtcA [Colwellia sp. RSH04]|uniref:tRNA 2-thiocytidine(32) synthetase TtcA n=1 Tax=Colwellia sp. RSH04 TaxID=2305464 RepID=UPI000E574B98|nr:tRNA 2-thiocytidine(32) synthetase TtcA [Colwellia sp. RSH04]RHW76998.1 tRNA 2-thiocytidine(32) synthetase TtcA [Colwellia sp. RSH04]